MESLRSRKHCANADHGHGNANDEEDEIIPSVLQEFIAEANVTAFERILMHLYHYRDQMKDCMFMDRSQVRAELLNLSDSLKDLRENTLDDNVEEEADQMDRADRQEEQKKQERHPEHRYQDNDAYADEEASTVLRIHLEKGLVDGVLRSFTDMIEKGFECVRERMERLLLASADDNDENAEESWICEEDDLFNDETDVKHTHELMMSNSESIMTDRSTRRLISRIAYKTHNMQPSLSVDLRKIAYFHVRCICERSHSKQEHTGGAHAQHSGSISFKQLINEVRRLVDADFERNRYSADIDSVNCFRRQQLVRFLNWSPEDSV